MVISYLTLIEVGKHWFYRTYHAPCRHAGHARHGGTPGDRVRRRAARFTTHTLRPPGRPVRGGAAPSTSPQAAARSGAGPDGPLPR